MRTIALFVICASMLSGCKKDDNGFRTREELLSGKWKMTANTESPAVRDYNGDGTKDSNVFANMSECVKDNILIFYSNGIYEEDEGATKCSPTDNQTKIYSVWELSDNEKDVTVDGIKVTIDQLDEQIFRITFTTVYLGTVYTGLVTYARQP